MTGSTLRVLVVDDHPVFRIGLSALLESLDGIEVVGQAATQNDAVAAARDLDPDVVVMDLDLGGGSGVEATRDLTRTAPRSKVLVVTMFADDESLFASLRAGARGYLLKGATPAEVERAIRSVANGELLFGPGVATRAADHLSGVRQVTALPFPELTDREREVLDLVARGLDNAAIARRLVLSGKTVRNYVSGIFAKLHVLDRGALIVRAREAGLGGERPADG